MFICSLPIEKAYFRGVFAARKTNYLGLKKDFQSVKLKVTRRLTFKMHSIIVKFRKSI